jgi:mono/diheme cytochrome c family protein
MNKQLNLPLAQALQATVFACFCLGVCCAAAQAKSPAQAPRFETDVRPIFKAHCTRCHGEKSRKGGLDLRNREGVLQGSESGPVIVPGKALESLLFQVVHRGKMPPKNKDQLSKAEVQTIRHWIQAGAPAAGNTGTVPPAVAQVSQHDIIPLMLRHCTACHGGRRKEAGLDLRSRAAMLKGGKSGPALRPGNPDQSLMLKKIKAGAMPPFRQLMSANVTPMTAREQDRLAQWIAQGAPEAPTETSGAGTRPDPVVTDGDRKFWAFRPPAAVSIPSVRHADRIRNPVDSFILNKLEAKGLTLAPEADRLTLLRRATIDLTGLLPEPDEIQAFLADRDPNAYERLIDRLLASQRYGERWGRYWLDLAGYADSDGHFGDTIRPYAYRYRDYVIRSFNADKSYDRFLLEQIARDELAIYEHASVITSQLMDNLVATGFLRLAPDGTNPIELNYVQERLDVITDEMEIFSSAVLGLTFQCARCHDHKYDPIPQRDYYRLLAVFKGAYDEYDWLRPVDRVLPHVVPEERLKQQAHNRRLQERIGALRQAPDRQAQSLRQKYQEQRLAKLPEVLRADLRRMLATPPQKRSAVQRYLAEKFEKSLRFDPVELQRLDAGFKKLAEETARKTAALQEQLLPGAGILALWDRGEPSPTYIYRQGDFHKPGRLVEPGVPSVLTDGRKPFVVKPPWRGAKKTGRRLALARWLTRPDHPLTARVMVNRIWKHHFGRGLVATLDNFGHTGARPSHPELLDWLAREFVRRGWSIKAVHRLLMTSQTYRQACVRRPETEKRDPDIRLLARMPLQRMQGEVLYDSLLQVAGRLLATPFGMPDAVQVQPDGLVTPAGTAHGWRRSIYVLQRRKEIPTLLENFDFPQMTPNCIERFPSTVSSQALTLMNDAWIHRLAAAFARRVRKEGGTDPARQIERVYLIALSRPPTSQERAIGLQALARLTEAWRKTGRTGQEAPAQRALSSYCHAIMNFAAFLTID